MDELLHLPREESAGQSLRARLTALEERYEHKVETLRQKYARQLVQLERVLSPRRLVRPAPFLVLTAAVGAAAVLGTVYTPACAVSVDGVELGVAESRAAFDETVDRVEAQASEILGYQYTLDGEISYRTVLVERGTADSAGRFETALFNRVGEVMKRYVLSVDGQVIGAAATRQSVENLLERVADPYTNENTVSSSFLSNVQITYEYVPTGVEQDADRMYEALTANTTGETTYTVQAGDTFMALAFDNGMSMEEMEALNPGVDVDKLMIGQELNVRESIPVLSVETVDHVTYTAQVEPPVEEVKTDSLYQGESKVVQTGSVGTNEVTADVTYVNGVERSRTVTDTKVITEPVKKIVQVGTKERPSWLPKGYFIWPVYGRVTSQFGYRSIFGSYSYHGGIDIAASYGTAISAADGGTVVFAGRATGSYWSYGNLVIIDHGNGKQTYYGHCSSILVSAGSKVYQGQAIARVGSTGRSTGNHCHFEVKVNGSSRNPYNYLS